MAWSVQGRRLATKPPGLHRGILHGGDTMHRAVLALFALIFFGSPTAAQFAERRLEAIRSTKVVKIAYRADSRPFSFVDTKGEPVGYTIDLCRLVVRSLERQLGEQLSIEWVPAESRSRFMAVASGTADMECGSSTITLGRMKEVDFSSIIF